MSEGLELAIKAVSVALMALSVWAAAAQVRRNPKLETGRPGKRRWIYVVAAVLGSRALILLMSLALGFGPVEEMWTRWDAVHYTTIVEQGYTADQSTQAWLNIVFFPLYPALCRLLGGNFWAMLAVSWGCLAGAAVVIDRLCPPRAGFWALLWLCLFPVTVFLGAPYTESLFLLTTAMALEMVRRKKWLFAGIWGMLAALTRNVGVLTSLAFITGYLMDFRERVERGEAAWRGLVPAIIRGGGLWCALIPLGTVLYLGLNQAIYGDPFIFMQIQKDHWSQSFGFFGQTMVTSLSYALYYDEWLYRICLFIPQTALMAITLVALPFLLRRMTAADAVYSVAYVLCIMSPTWLLSFPRYLMGMATLYPAMARAIRPRWARIMTACLLAAAMIPLTIAYLRGWPVL